MNNINNNIKIKYEKQIFKMVDMLGQGGGAFWYLEDIWTLLGAESVEEKMVVKKLLENNFKESGFVEVYGSGKYYIKK